MITNDPEFRGGGEVCAYTQGPRGIHKSWDTNRGNLNRKPKSHETKLLRASMQAGITSGSLQSPMSGETLKDRALSRCFTAPASDWSEVDRERRTGTAGSSFGQLPHTEDQEMCLNNAEQRRLAAMMRGEKEQRRVAEYQKQQNRHETFLSPKKSGWRHEVRGGIVAPGPSGVPSLSTSMRSLPPPTGVAHPLCLPLSQMRSKPKSAIGLYGRFHYRPPETALQTLSTVKATVVRPPNRTQ